MTTIAPEHDLLVRAALSADPDAREAAYAGWRRQVDVDLLDGPQLRLLPMLVDRFAADAGDDPVAERLRRIVRFTWLSSQLLFSRVVPVLKSLQEAGVPAVIVKGGAVLQHTGVNPGLRPIDDLDVLVPFDRVFDATEVLGGLELESRHPLPSPEAPEMLTLTNAINLSDGQGAQLDLHWHLLRCSRHPSADVGFHERAVPGRLRDFECRVLSAEDTLINVVEHGCRWSTEPALRWTSDATLLLRSCELDWDRLVATSREHRMAETMASALDYLVGAVEAPVPEEARRELRRSRATVAQWHRRRRAREPLTDGGPRLPGPLGRAIEAWDDYASRTLPPGRRARAGDLLGWGRSMWLLQSRAGVPVQTAFVALGRPWRLRRLLGGHRRAAAHYPGLPVYEPGTPLRIGIGEAGSVYAVAGWDVEEEHRDGEEHGRWTRGGLGRIVLPLAGEPPRGEWALEADCSMIMTEYRNAAEVDVVVDGRHAATWSIAWMESERRAASFPAPRGGPLEILFRVRHAITPADARWPGSDTRQIGLMLSGLTVGPEKPAEAAR